MNKNVLVIGAFGNMTLEKMAVVSDARRTIGQVIVAVTDGEAGRRAAVKLAGVWEVIDYAPGIETEYGTVRWLV